MTAVMQPNQLWATMPGWGIVADLTPPELIASRRLRVIRRMLVAAFSLLIVLCLLAFGAAWLKHRSAADALSAEEARSVTLQAEQNKYGAVTRMQTAVGKVNGQVAGLMAGDVSYAPLMAELRRSLPGNITINQLAIVVNAPGAGAAAAGGAAVSSDNSLDTSGKPHIGTITISGVVQTLPALASYVDNLSALPGIVDVLAPTAQASSTGLNYSITASFTDALLSHKFDSTKGSK